MPCDVYVTPRADQQLADLTKRDRSTFDQFVDMLAEGCAALAYRLAGELPLGYLCVKHLDARLRVIVAFETVDRAWIVLVGEHDQTSTANVYDELTNCLRSRRPTPSAPSHRAAIPSTNYHRASAPLSTRSWTGHSGYDAHAEAS